MMKRSQIYLPVEQWRRLSALSHQAHISVSEMIRRALDKVYQNTSDVNFEQALQQAAGLWKDRKDIPATSRYIRRLRKAINGEGDLDVVRTVRAAGYALDTEPV